MRFHRRKGAKALRTTIASTLHASRLTLLLVGLLATPASPAYTSSRHWGELECYLTAAAPVLDGDLKDRCWSEANVIGPFWEESRHAEAAHGIRAYAAYDANNLYLAIQCERRGTTESTNDSVEVMLFKFKSYGIPIVQNMPRGLPPPPPERRVPRTTQRMHGSSIPLNVPLENRELEIAGRLSINAAAGVRAEFGGKQGSIPSSVSLTEGGAQWTTEAAIPWKLLGQAGVRNSVAPLLVRHSVGEFIASWPPLCGPLTFPGKSGEPYLAITSGSVGWLRLGGESLVAINRNAPLVPRIGRNRFSIRLENRSNGPITLYVEADAFLKRPRVTVTRIVDPSNTHRPVEVTTRIWGTPASFRITLSRHEVRDFDAPFYLTQAHYATALTVRDASSGRVLMRSPKLPIWFRNVASKIEETEKELQASLSLLDKLATEAAVRKRYRIRYAVRQEGLRLARIEQEYRESSGSSAEDWDNLYARVQGIYAGVRQLKVGLRAQSAFQQQAASVAYAVAAQSYPARVWEDVDARWFSEQVILKPVGNRGYCAYLVLLPIEEDLRNVALEVTDLLNVEKGCWINKETVQITSPVLGGGSPRVTIEKIQRWKACPLRVFFPACAELEVGTYVGFVCMKPENAHALCLKLILRKYNRQPKKAEKPQP